MSPLDWFKKERPLRGLAGLGGGFAAGRGGAALPDPAGITATGGTKTTGVNLAQQVILVPILRAGLGLLEGFVKFLPDAEKGHIGLYRDEQTYEPVEYLFKLPKTKNKKVLVLDPMLATGNSSIAAINLIKNKGVKVKDIFLVSLLAAPEGIKNLQKNHRALHIFTCKIDAKLNKNKFIVPGLGDAGDRYMGT